MTSEGGKCFEYNEAKKLNGEFIIGLTNGNSNVRMLPHEKTYSILIGVKYFCRQCFFCWCRVVNTNGNRKEIHPASTAIEKPTEETC